MATEAQQFAKKFALSDKERAGLSSSEVESLTKEFGLNFIETPEVSLVTLFFMQLQSLIKCHKILMLV